MMLSKEFQKSKVGNETFEGQLFPKGYSLDLTN